VVPDVPAIHRRFDYSVPPALAGEIRVGSRVRVELHGRRVAAWVVEVGVPPTEGVTVRPLADSSGAGPPASVVSLAEWAAWRWAGPLSSYLGTASPDRVVRSSPSTTGPDPDPGPRGGDGRGREARPGSGGQVESPGGGSVALVDEALAAAGDPAMVRLAPALDAGLVVLECIHRIGAPGCIVLVPSHARAAQLAERLREAGAPVALMPDMWREASTGSYLVVGTRAAAWAPVPRLAGAVVLDAHDETYREERAPTWSAVDVIVERGRRDEATVLLVSPCPPVALAERARVVTTSRAVERRGWPVVEVVDRTGDDPRTGLFSERLVRSVRSGLDRPDGRVVCILNRTGRIRLLACRQCGALAACSRCGGAVAQDVAAGGLRCRRCGEIRPAVCAECDSNRLKALRVGVTRATEELSALTGVTAVEVTAASDVGAGSGARLVVGTEAALRRSGRVDLVAFLDIDQHLMAPRFGAGEETLSLVASAAHLVGARAAGGRVLVQTRIPDHEALQAAVHADPSRLAVPERALRELLELPPFGVVTLLRGPGAAAYAEGLRSLGSVTVSSSEPDRWMVRSSDHTTMADALASVPRPPERLRVEVDATDA